VSPGSAPSTKNGPVSGLSPWTLASVSPGFWIALPKKSNVLVSMMSPGFTVATGLATPNRYLRSARLGS